VLKGTRYLWLRNPENMKAASRSRFELLRKTSLRVARAWSMKETARHLWHYRTRRTARRTWNHVINIRKRNGQDGIDPTAPPSWRMLSMPSDAGMNGQQAIGGCFPIELTLPFLDDMGSLI
jgi:hypothetical protein